MNNNNAASENHSQPVPSQEGTLQDYIEVILRGKRTILVSVIIVLTGVALYTFFTKPVYESTAMVLVDTKGQQTALRLFDVTGIGAVKNVKNELEILKSRSLTEAVARRLLETRYTDVMRQEKILIIEPLTDAGREDTVSSVTQIAKRLEKAVEFDPVRDSDVIKITAKSTQAREAALIANTFAQIYYDRNMFTSRTRSRAVREFLEDQLKAKKTALDESENALQQYMEQHGIVSLDDEAKKIIGQLSELEAQRDAADISIQSLTKTLTSYQEQLANEEPNVVKVIREANDPYIRLLQEQLAKLEVQRDVTIAQNPSYAGQEIYMHKLKEIDDQADALRTKLQKRTEEFIQSLIPGQRITGQTNDPASFLSEAKQKIIELQIELQALHVKKMALTNVIGQYEKQFESIPQKNIQFARLQRSRLSNEKLYLLVEEKFHESAIKEKSEFGYIDIIDPAYVPIEPVSPRIPMNLALGALLGLMLGIGLTFFHEYLDVRIRTPEDLEKKGYVTLTAVALMNEEIQRFEGRTKLERDGLHVDTHLLSYLNPISSIAESYRRLRTKIQYAQVDRPVQSMLVTSPNPGEGKSTTVSNLAVTFAQAGKKVILIDTDLRRPSLHSEFGMDKQPGLTELLINNSPLEIVVRKTPLENLDIVCCGTIPPNPAETLGSQRMKHLIEELKGTYDVLLLDSPPVLAVTDPTILSTIVDGVIIVVSSNRTRIDTLDRSVELIQSVGGKCLGLVLNNFDLRMVYGGYYRYYKYKYYNYGYGYQYGTYGSGNGKEEKVESKEA
ncbi:MAG: polysaccharide biosynthesis tyrosine autokinase [Ignavibacteriae bacterium]|nr:polysaccharide biosynthesis tyrosine autokinase [Ignavibacteriota bacterium]